MNNIIIMVSEVCLQNSYFQNWPCIQIIGTVTIAIFGGIWFVWKRSDEETRKAVLSVKEQVSIFFEKLVFKEVRVLINIIDNYLPDALSQVKSEQSRLSRFDHFCAFLKKIPDEELSRERGKYAEVIRESFSSLLIDEVEKLISSLSYKISHDIYNPCHIRYGLEGDTVLRLDFIARQNIQVQKLEIYYNIWKIIALVLLVLSAMAGVCFCFLSFLFTAEIAFKCSTVSLWTFFISLIGGLISTAFFALKEYKLKNMYRACQNDPGFEKAFAKWKGRQN
ncbi:MAG: hypothetical protein PHY02_05050 [Phycisphaerae bacterium]|nr:hypothetical protein [Phycisphaerae bacterium]